MSFSWRFTVICLLSIPWPIPLAFQVTLQPHQCRCCSHFFRLSSCLTLVFLFWSDDEGLTNIHWTIQYGCCCYWRWWWWWWLWWWQWWRWWHMMIVFWWWQWRWWQYDDRWQLAPNQWAICETRSRELDVPSGCARPAILFFCLQPVQRVLRCWYNKLIKKDVYRSSDMASKLLCVNTINNAYIQS